jgi:hypothetical protein
MAHLSYVPAVDPNNPRYANMSMVIAVGFGSAYVFRDGKAIFDGESPAQYGYSETDHTLAEFEAMAQLDPDHDWRVELYAPLKELEYQRQADGRWLLIRTGMGFA